MSLALQPIDFDEAVEFVRRFHRHHRPAQGWKFGIAVNDGREVVGVVMVGRPVSRHLDDGWVLEVTRCCTDGTKNAASMLYGAAWRAVKAMGYLKCITYLLEEEHGVSLKAAGWKQVFVDGAGNKVALPHWAKEVKEGKVRPFLAGGGSWSCRTRPRVDTHPLGQKTLWEAA